MSIAKQRLQRIIQEEIGLVLVSHLPITVEPRDVADAFHPAEVIPREDAWAGGDNIEDDLDHAEFETGESNSGPHSAISLSHNSDYLTPDEVADVGYTSCKKDFAINEENNMNLRSMILQEAVRLIREGHGCGCGNIERSCSKCNMKDKIMMAAEEPADDMGSMSSDDAFGSGCMKDQGEREVFNYTGDLSDLTPEETLDMGHKAGMMNLAGEDDAGWMMDVEPVGRHMADEQMEGVPHPESYRKVRQFLQANPDLIDVAVRALMKMTGSTCPKSTKRAIYDHLSEIDPAMGDHGG